MRRQDSPDALTGSGSQGKNAELINESKCIQLCGNGSRAKAAVRIRVDLVTANYVSDVRAAFRVRRSCYFGRANPRFVSQSFGRLASTNPLPHVKSAPPATKSSAISIREDKRVPPLSSVVDVTCELCGRVAARSQANLRPWLDTIKVRRPKYCFSASARSKLRGFRSP